MESRELSDLLQTLLLSLRDDIKPGLDTANARHRAELIDMLLVRLSTEFEASTQSEPPAKPIASTAVDKLANAIAPDINELAVLEKTIATFAATEKHRRNLAEERLAEINARRSDALDSGEELQVPKERFSEYLRKKFPEHPHAEVKTLTIIPGGRSKGTLLLDIDSNGISREIIVRLDFSSMVTGVSVAYEYPIVSALHEAGIKVPQPLWLETDTSITGGVFVTYDKVPGQAMGTLFQSDAPAHFVRQYAAVLAQVHSLNIDGKNLADKLTWGKEDHPVRAMVDTFYQRYSTTLPRTPLMDTAFAWLYLQLEKIPNQRVLVHGDAGLHNTLGENGELTSLLDWELAHAGDPAEDLCYCKQVVESIMPWAEFMAAYHANGGRKISDEQVGFFSVWRALQLAIQCAGTRQMFATGVDRDLRIAAIGFNTLPKFLNILATELAKFSAEQ